MDFETSVDMVEVAEQPQTDVEAQEVVEPVTESEAVVETEQEATPPARDKERDSWFAEQRRKLDSERKELETKFQSQIEAERNRIAELETKTKTYEVNDRNARLRELAEQKGWDADALIAQADEEERLEAERNQTKEELQNEKTEKQKLADEKKQLEDELYGLKMSMEDREELLKFDPTINLNELSKDFYQLRSVMGKTPIEAYKMSQAAIPQTVVAESPGKINSTPAENEYFTEAEFDAMTPEQQDYVIANDWEKVKRSHNKWLGN